MYRKPLVPRPLHGLVRTAALGMVVSLMTHAQGMRRFYDWLSLTLSVCCTTVAALSYLGTVDDVVLRYPWNFTISKARLEHSLAVQIITGSPVLINDGYFILHPIIQESLQDKDSLIWAMAKAGYLRIMSRGFGSYGLDEMPLMMASSGGVDSFKELIAKSDWNEIQKRLRETDEILSSRGHLQGWPAFNLSSGYLLFAQKLLRESTSETVGISQVVRNDVFCDFLKEFVDDLASTMKAPRTLWENLAVRYAVKSGVTTNPGEFVRALMNLANEIYHYNMGVALSADLGLPISVETQASAAFDDLLVTQQVVVEDIPMIPRIHIPRVVLTANPSRLIEILEHDREVFKARKKWLDLTSTPSATPSNDIREAGLDYARQLADHFGAHINYKESEGIMNFAIGKLTELPKDAIIGLATSAGAGLGFITGVPPIGAFTGLATGYLVSRLQKNMLGTVTKKFRVLVLKNQIVPPDLLLSSKKAVDKIMSRKAPSAIEIDFSKAQIMAQQMSRFNS